MSYTHIPSPPLTYIGWKAGNKLAEELEKYAPREILVIVDPMLISLNTIKPVIDVLDNKQYIYTLYSDLIPEPTIETAQKAIDFARSGQYSLVLGFGGGSALDMAKLVAVFYSNPGHVKEYLNLTGTKKIIHKGLPKILIPTTSGTGTEVTNISVLALEKTKDVIVHEYLVADIAIVDARFTLSVPPKVTAATGADALTHAIEAFISVNANPYSNSLALHAIRLIGGSLETAVHDGNNPEARIQMAYGSYLAGLAFFNAGVGAIHALAYPLGGQFHIAHGNSNAVLIPYVLHYIREACASKMADIVAALGFEVGENPAMQCVQLLAALTQKIGIPQTLHDFNIPETAIPLLVSDGIQQKRLLERCPMTLNAEDISRIYTSAFKGQFADRNSPS